eukprot:Gb_26493 [translate_table: standard]
MFWEDNSRCLFDITRGASPSSKTCFVLAKTFSSKLNNALASSTCTKDLNKSLRDPWTSVPIDGDITILSWAYDSSICILSTTSSDILLDDLIMGTGSTINSLSSMPVDLVPLFLFLVKDKRFSFVWKVVTCSPVLILLLVTFFRLLVGLSYSRVTLGYLGVVHLIGKKWGVGILIAEEVSDAHGDVKGKGGIGSSNARESHKLGLSEMRGETMMPIDRSNGGMTFIPNSPSLLETMAMDEGDGEVAQVERGAKEISVFSPRVRGVSCEGVGGGMIRSSRVGTLEENGAEDTRVVGGVVAGEDVICGNTLPGEGILKEEGEPMLGGVAVLGPTEEEIVPLELAIKAVGEMIELPVVVADVGGNWTSCLLSLFRRKCPGPPGRILSWIPLLPNCQGISRTDPLWNTGVDKLCQPCPGSISSAPSPCHYRYGSIDDGVEVSANRGDVPMVSVHIECCKQYMDGSLRRVGPCGEQRVVELQVGTTCVHDVGAHEEAPP